MIMNPTRTDRVLSIIKYAILVTLAFFFIFPFYWMVVTSLKTDMDVFKIPPKLLPIPMNLKYYPEVWKLLDFNLYLFNTLKIAVLNVLFSVITSALAAYAFARLKFPKKRLLFNAVIATMILPTEVILIPQYIEFHTLGWTNSPLPLIVPSLFGNAFFIFLIRQYLMGIPYELDEAAIIDGCGRIQIFGRIILPLLTPVLTTCAVFMFMWSWNDLLGPLIYLNTKNHWTLTVGIASLNGALYSTVKWGHKMAMASLFSLFPLVVFFLTQKKLVGGIAATGLKS